MSYVKRKKHKKRSPPFVMIPWEILNSKAYQDLKPSSAKALPYFIGKHGKGSHKEGDGYEGTFEFTYNEALRHGFPTQTFSRIIKDLEEKGFVNRAGYGGLRGFCLSNNKFEISERWRNYETIHLKSKRTQQTT